MSKLDDKVARQLEDAGLLGDLGKREYLFAGDINRRWRADFAWPAQMLLVEIEGGSYVAGRHVRGASYEADNTKYLYAEMTGWHVLRFGPKAVASKKLVIVRAVKIHLWRWQMSPGAYDRQLADLVADLPKPPKPKKQEVA